MVDFVKTKISTLGRFGWTGVGTVIGAGISIIIALYARAELSGDQTRQLKDLQDWKRDHTQVTAEKMAEINELKRQASVNEERWKVIQSDVRIIKKHLHIPTE